MKKRRDANMWIDVGLRLGGLVAVFAGMAGAFMVLLSSRSYP